MIKNDFDIKEIVIKADAKCFCPLGQDWYTNHFEITLIPGDFIPDYCHVDKFIEENINGKEMIIEAATKKLKDYMERYFNISCQVVSTVNDAKHSDVKVTI